MAAKKFEYTVIFVQYKGYAIGREHFLATSMDAAVKKAISMISFAMKHDSVVAGGYLVRSTLL